MTRVTRRRIETQRTKARTRESAYIESLVGVKANMRLVHEIGWYANIDGLAVDFVLLECENARKETLCMHTH